MAAAAAAVMASVGMALSATWSRCSEHGRGAMQSRGGQSEHTGKGKTGVRGAASAPSEVVEVVEVPAGYANNHLMNSPGRTIEQVVAGSCIIRLPTCTSCERRGLCATAFLRIAALTRSN